MSRIIVETLVIDDIPILTVAEEGAEECPLIFFVHGFTGDKRQGLRFGYELAERGFYVVAPDAYMHGERPDVRWMRR